LFCAYEDRANHLVGLKLLVCSVARHMPGVAIHVTCPVADDDLRRHLARFPQVTLSEEPTERSGWDVKPTLLLRRLDAGETDVAWIDTDILLTRDLRPVIGPAGALMVAEEFAFNPPKESRLRAAGWQLPPGRSLPHLPNSGFVRVTPAHRALLLAWQGLIASRTYQDSRPLPLERRPFYMLGDQDVLTSLLCSRDFADLPVRFLELNGDILQMGRPSAYSPWARARHLATNRMPALIHAKETKPWQVPRVPRPFANPSAYYDLVFQDNSPYTWFARQYRDEVGKPDFLDDRSLLGRVSRKISGDRPQLRGFVQSTEATARLHLAHGISEVERVVRFGLRQVRRLGRASAQRS